MRFIAYIFIAILTIGLIRSVIGLLANLFLNATVGPERSAKAPEAPKAPGLESLKKDPICGTFVAPSAALTLERAGQTHYFCSAECRNKFV